MNFISLFMLTGCFGGINTLHLQGTFYRSGSALLPAGCSVFVGSPALCLLRRIGSTLLCAPQLLGRVPFNFKQVAAHSKEAPAVCVLW